MVCLILEIWRYIKLRVNFAEDCHAVNSNPLGSGTDPYHPVYIIAITGYKPCLHDTGIRQAADVCI